VSFSNSTSQKLRIFLILFIIVVVANIIVSYVHNIWAILIGSLVIVATCLFFIYLESKTTDKKAAERVDQKPNQQAPTALPEKEIELTLHDYAEKILEKVPSWILVVNKEFIVVYANRTFYDEFSIKPAHILGQCIFNFLPIQDITKYAIEAFNTRKTQYGIHLETTDLYGRRRHLRHHMCAITLGKEKRENYLLLVIEDLTEKKQLENEAMQSKKEQGQDRMFLLSVLDQMSDGVIACDPQGKVTLFNRAAMDAHKLDHPPNSLDELTSGNRIYLANGDKSISKDQTPLSRVLRGEKIDNQEIWVKSGENKQQYFMVTGGQLTDSCGQRFGAVVTMHDITERKMTAKQLEESFEKLRNTLYQTVDALSVTAERRDPYTAGHQRRVAYLAIEIAKELHLTDNQIEGIKVAGILHDIGKIYVPSDILNKPGKLTEAEFGLFKAHPLVGYEILHPIDFPWPVAKIILQHHERINGIGYPSGLKSNEILLEAKILAVADVVEAMASHRPYRPALGIDPALEEITKKMGILYDPTVAKACVRIFKEKGFDLGH